MVDACMLEMKGEEVLQVVMPGSVDFISLGANGIGCLPFISGNGGREFR